MSVSGLGNKARSCLRGVVFVVFLTFMTLLFHYYDVQYSNFIDYPAAPAFLIKNYNDSDIPEEQLKAGYIVWSPFCRIPNVTAFHPSIQKCIYQWKGISCSNVRPLTSIAYNRTTGRCSLKVLRNVVRDYSLKANNIQCCYSSIKRTWLKKFERKNDDDRYELGKPSCFQNQTNLPVNIEFLHVNCTTKRNWEKPFYQNIHSIVIEKTVPMKKKPKFHFSSTKKYSVLLFGIDSISRLNLIRTMPKSKRFVDEQGWIPLEGYNKIADNTFPNLMAVLTGWTLEQISKRCFKKADNKLDDCPFIWKNFSQKGYLTAYTEDEPFIGTFNYHKYGFLNSPTDYYSRPLMVHGMRTLKVQSDGGMNYCMGIQPQAEYLFQYNTDLVQRLQYRPYFNLFWTNSYSHNEVNMPSIMDDRVHRFLEDIQPYLNSTIVLFFSDHGSRFGPIRETYVGWLEERLPFLYFWIPPSFRAAYPHKFANLIANRNRLISPFDVHATLQDILYGQVVQIPDACSTCDSLFKKAVWNRSCEDAGITAHWCTCFSDEDRFSSTGDPAVVNAVQLVIQNINDFIAQNSKYVKSDSKCAVINLKKIVTVRSRHRNGAFFSKMEYTAVFEVQPSGGLFEFTWSQGSRIGGLESISRINLYGDQSACVTSNSELKKYCFCVNT